MDARVEEKKKKATFISVIWFQGFRAEGGSECETATGDRDTSE